MKEIRSCKVAAIPGSYFKSQWAMAVNKGFPFQELFNIMILRMKENGLQETIFRRYNDEQGGEPDCGKRQKGSSLGMKSVISAFIILATGIFLSLTIFMFEKVLFCLM